MKKIVSKTLTLADIERAMRKINFPEDNRNYVINRNYAIVTTKFGNIKIKV